jgi:hypothetical protein
MFPPVLKIKGHGRVIGKSWEGALGGIINLLIFRASCAELQDFIWSACGFIVDDIEVRVGGGANGSCGVVVGPR